jgi:predicted transcriptional regulator
MNYARQRRRHPLDVVYECLILCKEPIGPTRLASLLNMSYISFKPFMNEILKLKLVFDQPAERPESNMQRWNNLRHDRKYTKTPGAPSEDGYFHTFKTTVKGHAFMSHYESIAELMGEKLELKK